MQSKGFLLQVGVVVVVVVVEPVCVMRRCLVVFVFWCCSEGHKPKLLRFQGRPKDLSPLARWKTWQG